MCIRELPDPECREEQVVLVTNEVFRGLVWRCLEADSDTRPTMQEIIDELKGFNAAHPVASSATRPTMVREKERKEISLKEHLRVSESKRRHFENKLKR